MTQRTKKKLDTIAFAGALLAFIGFLLAWFSSPQSLGWPVTKISFRSTE